MKCERMGGGRSEGGRERGRRRENTSKQQVTHHTTNSEFHPLVSSHNHGLHDDTHPSTHLSKGVSLSWVEPCIQQQKHTFWVPCKPEKYAILFEVEVSL